MERVIPPVQNNILMNILQKGRKKNLVPQDYILKGQIYGNNDPNVVYDSYVKAASMDSVYESKMKTIQDGIDWAKAKNNKILEGQLRLLQSANKKTPNPADAFFTGLAFYQGADYKRQIACSNFTSLRSLIVCMVTIMMQELTWRSIQHYRSNPILQTW